METDTVTDFNFNDAYGSKFLSASDIGDVEVPVTISTVKGEMLSDKSGVQKPRLIIGFTGRTKLMVLNRTNAKALARGTKTEVYQNWIGTKCLLSTHETSMGPGLVLRVVTTAAQDMNDSIDF